MNDTILINTISEAHEIMNLEKPKHPLVSFYLHEEIDFSVVPSNSKIRLDLYHIMFKKGVSGSFGYGRNKYDFQDGTIVFTSPGQVMHMDHNYDLSKASGWSLMFHPDLIRRSELGKHIDQYNFFSYDVHEALHLSNDEVETISELTNKIVKEYSQNIDRHSQKLIVSNIELIMDYCTRYYDRQFYTRTNMNKDIVSRFIDLLKSYYSSEKPLEAGLPTVKYCGDELNMSPNYLSDLLKKETGRNAQDHIHLYLVDKAKTQLLNSSEPVSQIAYGLGFEYPQHFSKLFKKKTGMSPLKYRSLN